jgi:hypothetical protein
LSLHHIIYLYHWQVSLDQCCWQKSAILPGKMAEWLAERRNWTKDGRIRQNLAGSG